MSLRRLFRDCSGAAAAELALVLPGIAFIALNVVDLGTYVYEKMQVGLAAQEAVGAARVLCDTAAELPATPNCGGTLASTMLGAAQTTSLGNAVTITATTEVYNCADATGTFVQVANYDETPPDDCSGAVSGSTSAPGDYISATVSYDYTPLFPGASVASALSTPITRTAWLRLK
jgi:Flp pilus assembly protein TadG